MEKLHDLTSSLEFAEATNDTELEGSVLAAVGRYDKATEQLEMHLTVEREKRDKRGERAACGNLAIFCRTLGGQYDKSIKHIETSLSIAKEIGDKQGEGRAYGNLGICYQSLGQYDKAIKHIEKNIAIAKDIADKQGEGRAHGNLGVCYIYVGQYDKAIRHAKMHLIIAEEIGDKQGKGIAYGNLGACYIYVGQYDKAIRHANMHLTIAEEIGDKQGAGTAYGNLGTCYKYLGQYDKAIKHIKKHLTIAKEIRDKQDEGTDYGNLGTCYKFLGQYDNAIKHIEMQLAIAKEMGDKQGEGRAHGSLGLCSKSLGQYDKAIKHIERQLTIAKETGDEQGEEAAYGNLGTCYIRLGQYDKAIKHIEMDLTIAEQIGNKQGEETAYCNFGACYIQLGQYNKAIEYLEMTLTIAKEIGDKHGEGAAYGNLGTCYKSLGQYDKAFEHIEMFLNIAEEIGDKEGEGKANSLLGTLYNSLGQYDKAIQHIKMYLTIAEKHGLKEGEGTAYGNLGICCRYLGHYDKAIKNLEIHLTIAKEIGDKQGEGAAYGNLGACYAHLGQYDKALKYIERQLTIAKEIGDKQGEGAAYGNLGTCYKSLGQYDKAVKHFKMCLSITEEIGNKEGEGKVYGSLGICNFCFGQYEKAERTLRKGLQCYEELFDNVPKLDECKVSFIETFITIYRLLIKTLLAEGKTHEALTIAKRGRARALIDLMLTPNPFGYATIAEGKTLDLYEIRKVVKILGSTVIFFALFSPGICTWVIQPNGDVVFWKRFFTKANAEQFRKYYLEAYAVQDLKSLIDKTLKLMTSCRAVICEDRSLSFLYSEEVSKPAKKKPESMLACGASASAFDLTVLQPMVFQSGILTRTTGSVDQQETEVSINYGKPNESILKCLLRDLYKILLEPARQYVVGSQAIVVPDRSLALVPFAALMDENGHYVADSLQVRLIPSLTVAKMIRERPEEPAGQGRPLIVGDPDVGEVLMGDKVIPMERLPCANTELQMVGQLLHVEPIVGRQATKTLFLQEVENANLIHLAAHGNAEKGEILLAPSCSGTSRNKLEDIMLTISDLEHKRLKAKLVVLSCCHSGRGDVRAEGVVGIGRAFLGAGARAVLVTLWAVDDAATLCFMCYFYKYLIRGKSANAALNKAMKATRKELEKFRHPLYWAPFVLLGDDVTPFGLK